MNFAQSTQSFQNAGAGQGQGFIGGGYNGPGQWPQNFQGLQNSYNGPQGQFTGQRGVFNKPAAHFGQLNNMAQNQGFGSTGAQQQFGGMQRKDVSGPSNRSESQRGKSSPAQKPVPSKYKGFVKPVNQEDHFEGGEKQSSDPSQFGVQRPLCETAMGRQPPDPPQFGFHRPLSDTRMSRQPSGPLQFGLHRPLSETAMSHPYNGPWFPGPPSFGMGGRFGAGGEGGGPMRARGRGFGRGPRFGGSGRGGMAGGDNFSNVEAATAAAARATREARNPNAKCVVLPFTNEHLVKFKRLTEEIQKLKSQRPNAIDKIHSAANIAHVNIQSEIESGPIVRGTGTFFCLVQFDGVNISVGTGLNKRSAKNEAFAIALEKLMKPHQRIVEIDGSTKELQASDYDYRGNVAKQTVIKPTSSVVSDISGDGGDAMSNTIQRESNVEAIVDIKKKTYMAKELSDFVLVEPQEHNSSVNGASILRRSADFSKMLLEYDFAAFGNGGAVRCVLKVEGNVLADIISHSKVAAKVEASQKAVDALRQQCYTILTKQGHDSSGPEITKDEILADLANCLPSNSASMSVPIGDGNLGKKLLQKMGWAGGGIGKDGAGIEEPVTMKQVINREGLGLDAKRGICEDFRFRVTELLENYASSERQDDLVFSPHFRKDERIIIHNECRRLNLKSKSNGQGHTRYLIVRRKRSANQLLDHVMQSGGETVRYRVVPPGERKYPWRPSGFSGVSSTSGSISTTKAQAADGKPGGDKASASTATTEKKPLPTTTPKGQGPPASLGSTATSDKKSLLASPQKGQEQSGNMASTSASDKKPLLASPQKGQEQSGGNTGPTAASVKKPLLPSPQGQDQSGNVESTSTDTKPLLTSLHKGQEQSGNVRQNWSVGTGGKGSAFNMIGQNPSVGTLGQMSGMIGQNSSPGMMGHNSPGMMGQNSPGMMGQNSFGMMGRNSGNMGQNSSGMMGQHPGNMAQNSGMMGQQSGMMGQNSPGMMGQNSFGMMGQHPGNYGQNSSGMMGQHPGNMAQNSGMMGQNSTGMMGQNSSRMMGQNSSGMMGQNSSGMMEQHPGNFGQNSSGMMGQNSSGMMGQNSSGMIGQNSSGMIGQNSSGMMGQNSSGMMGQNPGNFRQNSYGMMGQNCGTMGQNSSGMMGQPGNINMAPNSGMIGQHPGNFGQNSSGIMGQNSCGMIGQNSSGMMGQYPGNFGQNSSGMMGQNSFGMMGQNSYGMVGQNSFGIMEQNSGNVGQNSWVMGQNSSAGMMGQNSYGMMEQNSGNMGQNSWMMGHNSYGMMGQNSGMVGQNSSAGMMGQNSGMMGQNPSEGVTGQNSGMMGQNSLQGTTEQNSQ